MKYNDLKSNSNISRTRVGRGISAGKGKTAGRGTKGQKSRAGSGKKQGFEGGQTPLVMRLPKLRGFRSIRTKPETIYTGQLNQFKGGVNNFTLFEAGMVSSPYINVKLVVSGDELTTKLQVKLQGASTRAQALIQKAGGTFTKVPREKKQSTKGDKKTK